MKAVIFDQFDLDALKVVEVPEPQPGPGEVLVKMLAWSLNYRDLMLVRGQYNPKLKLPFTPLSDGVGGIVALGAGVEHLKIGERVAANFMPRWVAGELTDGVARSALGGGAPGVLAEYVALPAEGVVQVPKYLKDHEAAALPCAAVTAWNALVVSGNLSAGQTVLVQGSGGVSLFALQFARLHGATVIATSSSDEKLQRMQQLGAAHGINYREVPEWGERVRELTGGVGVDHVVEVGGAGTLPQSLRAVRTGGHIALIGVLAGPGTVNPIGVLMKNIRMQGIYVGSKAMFEAMNRALAAHQLRPTVDRVYGPGEIAVALRHLASGEHFGKVCLDASLGF